ncbi:MAG: Sec-independent protein translocase TatA [Phycisphaera sp.]|nr:Sec-independent protein translocase TatA [Phycisphaera sp.]
MFGMPGWIEILIICFVGVLIFGKRLPEVGKNLGKGIVEFKKGLTGIEQDVNNAASQNPPRQVSNDPKPASDEQRLRDAEAKLQEAQHEIEALRNQHKA